MLVEVRFICRRLKLHAIVFHRAVELRARLQAASIARPTLQVSELPSIHDSAKEISTVEQG